jgi:hypothetical protein
MAMQHWLRAGFVKPKLEIGGVDDPEERAADRTAERGHVRQKRGPVQLRRLPAMPRRGLRDLQSALRPRGVRHMQALPRPKPEDVQGAIPLQLPPEFDLGSLQPSGDKNNDFIVESDEFGVTMVHPASETRIRVVEQEHRYKPEEWSYETVKYPKRNPRDLLSTDCAGRGQAGRSVDRGGAGRFCRSRGTGTYRGPVTGRDHASRRARVTRYSCIGLKGA